MVSHQPVKFIGHRHRCSRVIMVLVCHVISEGNVIKGRVTLWRGARHAKSSPCVVW